MKIKITPNNEKILKKSSRETSFERYGGGQFVCLNRPHKNKKKYDRKQEKRELKKLPYFLSVCPIAVIVRVNSISP